MDDSRPIPSPTPSPALLAANRCLYALREQAQQNRLSLTVQDSPQPPAQDGDMPPWVNSVSTQPEQELASAIATLPAHLGWGSTTLSAHLRQKRKPQPATPPSSPVNPPARPNTQPVGQDKASRLPDFVKLYPDIGLGMLRQSLAAPGRIWLLLRLLDSQGCGWVSLDTARAQLTGKEAALRVCGWRQLRNLLRQGDGIFWQRDRTRIWLHSLAKTAQALGISRLTGRPVRLPVSALTGTMGNTRAHLYAAFHSGRMQDTREARPISRHALAVLSGVGATSQRHYEEKTKVRTQANYAAGDVVDAENGKERAWQVGRALFKLHDVNGRHGQAGRVYWAWRLPNSYTGPHQRAPKGRQRRVNRELRDLVMQGMPGNGEETVACQAKPERRYFDNGCQAAKVWNRKTADLYWRSSNRNGRAGWWYFLTR